LERRTCQKEEERYRRVARGESSRGAAFIGKGFFCFEKKNRQKKGTRVISIETKVAAMGSPDRHQGRKGKGGRRSIRGGIHHVKEKVLCVGQNRLQSGEEVSMR